MGELSYSILDAWRIENRFVIFFSFFLAIRRGGTNHVKEDIRQTLHLVFTLLPVRFIICRESELTSVKWSTNTVRYCRRLILTRLEISKLYLYSCNSIPWKVVSARARRSRTDKSMGPSVRLSNT